MNKRRCARCAICWNLAMKTIKQCQLTPFWFFLHNFVTDILLGLLLLILTYKYLFVGMVYVCIVFQYCVQLLAALILIYFKHLYYLVRQRFVEFFLRKNTVCLMKLWPAKKNFLRRLLIYNEFVLKHANKWEKNSNKVLSNKIF